MTDLQQAKAVVRDLYAALDAATAETAAEALAAHTAPGWRWRGVHPFGEREGAAAVAASFWSPLKRALHRIQRRPDIFMSGEDRGAGTPGVWVCEAGHLMGLFDAPWFAIQPTRRIVMLRYCEWNRVEDGRVVETALFADLPHLMWQAGQYPLPPPTGVHLVQPGPLTHDGVMHGPQDPARGEATMRCVEALLNNDIPAFDPQEARKLERVWRPDMIWWGPGGVGASYTTDRYVDQHCRPFDDGLAQDRRFTGEMPRIAEGGFGGFFGWSNTTVRNGGGFLGMTGGVGHAEMALVDLYRAEDGKLVENWVYIDMLGFLAQQGLDVLGRMATTARPGA